MADDDRSQLAQTRTEFAEDRTVLANERTFAGWLRTGYAGIGIGLAFNALFNRIEPAWVPKLVATVFLLIAVTIFFAAQRRACAVLRRLDSHQVRTLRASNVRLITWTSIAATLVLIGVIWLARFVPATVPGS
jgi:putative membrane protein